MDSSSCTEDTLPKPPPPDDLSCLHRMGSGASVVLDPEAGTEAESKKLPSSKFKGVVPQPNGRWGAQIYEKHQRVWLGTFSDEVEAARAYDVAVQRFRGREATTNFLPLPDGAAELLFLASKSKGEVVDMLRKHTYYDELQHSRHALDNSAGSKNISEKVLYRTEKFPGGGGGGRVHLFDKMLTPSDVGKLNRLVIPKKHAQYFPLPTTQGNITVDSNGVLLNLEDAAGKVWRFRYSYWNSSQSYVLTKGWSRFVKEKGLVAGDIVSFYRSTGHERQLLIDWKLQKIAGAPAAVGVVNVIRLFGVNLVGSAPAPPDARKIMGKRSRGAMELQQIVSPATQEQIIGPL